PGLAQASPRGAEHEARHDERDRRCEDGALQPARNEAEYKYNSGQHHEINHSILRWRRRCPWAARSRRRERRFFRFPLFRASLSQPLYWGLALGRSWGISATCSPGCRQLSSPCASGRPVVDSPAVGFAPPLPLALAPPAVLFLCLLGAL